MWHNILADRKFCHYLPHPCLLRKVLLLQHSFLLQFISLALWHTCNIFCTKDTIISISVTCKSPDTTVKPVNNNSTRVQCFVNSAGWIYQGHCKSVRTGAPSLFVISICILIWTFDSYSSFLVQLKHTWNWYFQKWIKLFWFQHPNCAHLTKIWDVNFSVSLNFTQG